MSGPLPEPVFLEVVDTVATSGAQGLLPTEVRLNGIPLAIAEGSPIVLHEIVVKPGQLVTATLTLVVSAVSVRPAEPPARRQPRPPALL